MKFDLTALIDKFDGIQPTKNGFKQRFILLQPELKNEYGDRIRKEQFFPVEIFNGERWLPEGKQDFTYTIKFTLAEMQNA